MDKQRVLIRRGSERIELDISAEYNYQRRILKLSVQFPYCTKTFAESKTEAVRSSGIRLSVDRGILPQSLVALVERVFISMDTKSSIWFKPEAAHLTRDPEGGYGAQLDLNPLPQLLQRSALDFIKECAYGKAGEN